MLLSNPIIVYSIILESEIYKMLFMGPQLKENTHSDYYILKFIVSKSFS